MQRYDRRRVLRTAGAGVGLFGAGQVGAQGSQIATLELGVDAWPEPTVGEEATFQVDISVVGDLAGTPDSSELTLELLVEGTVVDETAVDVTVGDDLSETLAHTFEAAGETTVAIEGSVTLSGEELSDSVSTVIDVAPEPVTVSGAAFEIPEVLDAEAQSFLDDIASSLPFAAPEPLLVANESELVLAAIPVEPRDALVTVEGVGVDVDFEPAGLDLSLGVVAATEGVGYDESHIDVTLQELSDDPEAFAFERVRVPGDHLATAVRTRSNAAPVSFATQTGVLVEERPGLDDQYPSAGSDLFHIVDAPTPERIERVLPDEPGEPEPFVFTGEFDTEFWEAAETSLTGVVIPPDSPVAEFVGGGFLPDPDHEERDEVHGVVHADGDPLLYVHEQGYGTRDDIDSVGDITAGGADLDGDLVALEVRVWQGVVSVKETIEEAAGCEAPDLVNVEGTCVPIFHDVLLHGGAAWDPDPAGPEDVVGFVGISAQHQEVVFTERTGVYDIVAEVVDTSRLDGDLPEGVVLVVYDMTFVEDIDTGDIADDIWNLIQGIGDDIVTGHEDSIALEGDSVPLPPQALPPFENAPQDLDGDGRYEDVDGDGKVDIFDVQALFDNLDSDPVQNNPGAFDFDGNGKVDIFDVQTLFEQS